MDMDLVLKEVIQEAEHESALDCLAECVNAGQTLLGTLHTVEERPDIARCVPGAAARLHGMEREARVLLTQLVDLEHQYAAEAGA